MKAIVQDRYGGAEVLEFREIDQPAPADNQVLRELIEAGKLRPLVGRTYPLGEVPEAMRALEAGSTRGKIVITV
jgi:NADPH:quinone reductase-like Zn-dependent oxidoreductase